MCDQYYGMAARARAVRAVDPRREQGRLPCPARPQGAAHEADPAPLLIRIRDLLADAAVQQGRLKGQKLSGGSGPPWPWDMTVWGTSPAPTGRRLVPLARPVV